MAARDGLVVMVQNRDRFAREHAYYYLLRREMEERECKIKALNERGDDSSEGELTDAIFDRLAKFERTKTAERTCQGKLQKPRQSKVIATKNPPYGIRYNEARDSLVSTSPRCRWWKGYFRSPLKDSVRRPYRPPVP